MIGTVWFFWFVHTHWTDGGSWLEWALTWTDGERTLQRVRVLNGAAALALSTGDAERSLALGAESLALGRDIDSLCQVTVIDSPLFGLAAAASVVGDYDRAIEFNEAALALCRSLAGVVPSAIPTESVVLTNMAHVARALNDEPRAIRLAEEALALQEEVGFTWGAVDSLWFLATVAEREDDTARAVILFCKSLSLAAECRDGQQVVVACERIALIAAQARRHEQAVRLMGAAERLREWLGNKAEPLVQERWDQAAVTARTRLGEMAFAAAWSAGRALSLEDAVTEARRIEAPTAPPSDNGPDRMGLTRREHQVLQLLAEGRSNRAIADVLSLSERTVENHVLHVLTKLNLESRTAAAAFAVRHGLG